MGQEYSAWERIRFLIVHMLQMETLVILLSTAAAAWLLRNKLKSENTGANEQVLSRNIAASCIGLILLLWIGGRLLR